MAEIQEQFETYSVTSVHSAKKEGYLFIKRHEALMAKEKKPKLLSFFSAFTVLGLGLLVALMFLLHASILDYLSLSRGAFVLASELVKLEFFIRQTLSAKMEETTFMYFIMASQIYRKGTIPDKDFFFYHRIVGVQHTMLPEVLGDPDYVGFSIYRSDNVYQGVKESSKKLMTTDILAKTNMDVLHKIFDLNIPVGDLYADDYHKDPKDYEKFGLYQFSLYLIHRLQLGISYMDMLRPYVTSQPLPLRVGLRLLYGYQKAIEEMFGTVMVICAGLLPKVGNIFHIAVFQTLDLIPSKFRKSFWGFFFSIIVLLFGIILTAVFIARKIERVFKKIFSAYTNLRPHEIDFHAAAYREFIKIIELSSNSEAPFLAAFSQIGEVRGKLSSNPYKTTQTKSKKKSKHSGQRSKIRFSQEKSFTFIKSAVLFNGIFFIFVSVNLILLFTIQRQFSDLIYVQSMHFGTITNYIPVSDNYLNFFGILNYGSFLKFNGKHFVDHVDHDSAKKFNDFQYLHKMRQFLPSKDIDTLTALLHGNFCEFFDKKTPYSNMLRHTCESYLPAKRGFASIVHNEAELIKQKKTELLSDPVFKKYLVDTREGFVVSPFTDYFYTRGILRVRLLHDATASVFMNNLFEIMDQYLRTVFEDTNSYLNIIQYITSTVLAIILLAYGLVIRKSFNESRQLSRETFNIILPECISGNPFISHIVRKELLHLK